MTIDHESKMAALFCGAPGENNCRHDWNRAHPDDQITEEDQQRAQDWLVKALEKDTSKE